MTRTLVSRGFMCALWLSATAGVLAQSGSLTYDPSAEVTVSGTIVHAVSFVAPDGAVGVHFDFKTPDGMLNVHVAPALYIGMQNFWFFADDQLEIVGMRSVVDGNKSFIARAVTKDGKTLTLRSADGKPAWSPATDGTDGCGVAHPALPHGTEL
ncbi:MAG TPA: hypothetical protein VKE51_30225 [Vicinamibacterales bacterium]|nr:hypothetical protein [Vicinamibacterales bacterium]